MYLQEGGQVELKCFSQVGRQFSISRKPLSVFGKICCLWLISDSMQDHITMITGGSSALVRLVYRIKKKLHSTQLIQKTIINF